MDDWELIIIGAGPAGLAAAIYAARSGLKTLIIEEKMAGGTTADAPIIENYPGFSKISGAELAEKMVLQCRQLGVTFHELESAIELIITEKEKIVYNVIRLLDDGKLYGKMARAKNPYGDGKAASKIVKIIKNIG